MAKKKTTEKKDLFNAESLGKKKAITQTTEADKAKVKISQAKEQSKISPEAKKQPKKELFTDKQSNAPQRTKKSQNAPLKSSKSKKMGRPRKTEEEKEATRIVNLRIHEDQLQVIDEHMKKTFQKNRHQYILDAVFQRIQREKAVYKP